MLIKLLPEQISKHWDFLKEAIERALPPVTGNSNRRMLNILEDMLTEKMHCWVNTNSKSGRINAIATTQIVVDDISGEMHLLLYSLYGVEPLDKDSWAIAFGTVAKFAESMGCAKVTAYSANPHVVKMAEEFGGDTSYRYISFPLFKK